MVGTYRSTGFTQSDDLFLELLTMVDTGCHCTHSLGDNRLSALKKKQVSTTAMTLNRHLRTEGSATTAIGEFRELYRFTNSFIKFPLYYFWCSTFGHIDSDLVSNLVNWTTFPDNSYLLVAGLVLKSDTFNWYLTHFSNSFTLVLKVRRSHFVQHKYISRCLLMALGCYYLQAPMSSLSS